jgi:hypothetical protein
MDLLHTSPQLWPKMFAHFTEFERALTEAIARRTGRSADTDVYPAVVAASVVAVMRVSITHWRTAPEHASLADLLTSSLDVLASGLTIPIPPQPIDGAQS